MEARGSALGKKTVLKLTERLRDKHYHVYFDTEKLPDKHYHVYFDNYFTSVELLEELLQRELNGCGTVRNGNCEIESE